MQKQKVKFYILLPVLVLAILTLTGCGKSISQKAGEKAAEKIIESRTGGKVDVDVDGENVKFETEQGEIEAGGDVKLPSDFPNDIYVIGGKINMVISNGEDGGYSVSVETDKSVEEASSIYQEKLKSEEWKITGTMNFGESVSIVAEKDDRNVSVMIGKSDSKTTVTIVVAKK
jgi:hypothetical protein